MGGDGFNVGGDASPGRGIESGDRQDDLRCLSHGIQEKSEKDPTNLLPKMLTINNLRRFWR
jgi:hypothetical protein